MGGGSWSSSTYSTRASKKAATGTPTFAYHSTVAATGVWKVHETLDPKLENKKGMHAGKNIRESMDSDEHPNATAIAVIFDVTGSMSQIPQTLQKKLPELFGLLLRKGYVEDPQVLFGAVGDAHGDAVPLQIGQFESDNRSDENLENFVLEGGGGGQKRESYELAAYYMARHTYLDCYEKRGTKGYLFIIGDEMPYQKVNFRQVENLIGDKLSEDISTKAIFQELQDKYEVFYFTPRSGASHSGDPEVLNEWRQYIGQNAIQLDDPNTVCEAIALAIGVNEGIDLDDAKKDLVAVGASTSAVEAAGAALSTVTKGKGSLSKATGDLNVGGKSGGSKRL